MHEPIEPTPETRLSIRTSESQKAQLILAAEARHTTVSQFVLEASLSAAKRVLADESELTMSPRQYAWLSEQLDQEPRELPKLREAWSKKPVWDE